MITTNGQAPTGLSHITQDQLKALIDAFARITWPAPAQAADQLLAELGWDRVRLRVARTGLPVNDDAAGIGLADGSDGVDTLLRDVDLWVTDSGRDLDAGALWDVFRLITGWTTDMIGPPVASEGDDIPDNPTVWWDLPGGGGVKMTMFDIGLTMYLLSKKSADYEQFEREHPEYTYE